jgi:uracil-DNA glycosylase family 4
MRGAQAKNWSVDDVAESYALWWHEAGLHSATSEEPRDWFAVKRAAPAPAPIIHEGPTSLPQTSAAVPIAAPRPAVSRTMPSDLAPFLTWLGEDAAQPEAAWEGPMFLPPSETNARLLILCDMPEAQAEDPALPFAPSTARFVTSMLAAIGLRMEDVAFAPLFFRRPPGGIIDEDAFSTVAERMRHYLALARPQVALMLGDRTSRALVTDASGSATGRLPEIRLKGASLPAAALASPELLMRRPMAKAASWQTLRLLHGTLNA